jgi:hypothetical protein
MQLTFNWPAVALAVLVGLFIHALWSSPFGFGKLIQRLEGQDDEAAKAALLPRLGLSLAAALLQALALAGAFNFTGSNSFGMGALAGLQLWAAFSAPAVALAVWPSRRSGPLLALHLGGTLVVAVLQGALLASWR